MFWTYACQSHRSHGRPSYRPNSYVCNICDGKGKLNMSFCLFYAHSARHQGHHFTNCLYTWVSTLANLLKFKHKVRDHKRQAKCYLISGFTTFFRSGVLPLFSVAGHLWLMGTFSKSVVWGFCIAISEAFVFKCLKSHYVVSYYILLSEESFWNNLLWVPSPPCINFLKSVWIIS
jgi:hypothetical protein